MRRGFNSITVLTAILVLVAFGASAQATMQTSGNWNIATNWSSSNIGDLISEDVTISTSVNPDIPTGLTYTIGSLSLVQDNTLTIKGTSTLNLGNSGSPKSMTAGNNGKVVVEAGATLEVFGAFSASGNFSFDIYGTIHIHGSTAFSNVNTSVNVHPGGKLIIDGAMASGQNTNFQVDGYVEVFGSLAVGSGSNLNGSGVFKLHGSCAGSWCSNPMLPVELLYFKSRNTTTETELAWATASEVDTDYFTIEKSLDGKSFHEIGRVSSMGDSHAERNYSFIDEKPAAGTSFYRLNEVARSGDIEVLSTIRSIFDGARSVYIYPNPVTKDQPVSFSLNFKTSEPHQISVYDMRGVLMGSASMTGSESQVPLQLSAGIYVIRIYSPEFNSVQRLVVQ